MQNFRPIAPVTKEIETKRQKSEILIHYDIIIKQTKNKKLIILIFFIPTQCFLPFVKIPSGNMISIAWRWCPPGFAGGQKPGAIRVKQFSTFYMFD